MHNLIRRLSSVPTPLVSDIHGKVKDLMFQGLYDQALRLYKDQLHDPRINSLNFIFPSLIKACSFSQTHHVLGLQLHCHALKMGFDSETILSNSLISMYAKVHDTGSALKVFDAMPQRDCVSWSSMLNCFTQNGCYVVESLQMFKDMYSCGFVAKAELIASVLSVCVRCGYSRVGRAIHAISIVDERIEKSVFLSTALVDLYWRCGDLVMAFRVFNALEDKNEVSWTAMISGYVGTGDYRTAFDCFQQMQFEGIKPNRVTLITILPACAEIGLIEISKDIHGYAFRHGFDSDMRLLSALIHLYSKSGRLLHLAKLVFNLSTKKDVILWSSVIAGCSQHKDSAEESLMLFNQMRKEGVQPNSVTLLAVIAACANIPSMSLGCKIHGYVFKVGLDSDLPIGNCLINMHSKCGSPKYSDQVFREMSTKDCISWSALISAYGLYGCGEEALQLFSEMKENGIEHDSLTLLALLSACNHAGLVEEGQHLFDAAIKDDKLLLNSEHYACYVDLLGRAGKLECAFDVLRTMPMKPTPRIFSSLVWACKLHGRLEVAETLLSRLMELEPDNAANHILSSLIYSESGKWLSVEGVWSDMSSRRLKKNYGFSRLEN